jgi:hypothetical protein
MTSSQHDQHPGRLYEWVRAQVPASAEVVLIGGNGFRAVGASPSHGRHRGFSPYPDLRVASLIAIDRAALSYQVLDLKITGRHVAFILPLTKSLNSAASLCSSLAFCSPYLRH